jgi:hypothetical protein
MQRIIDDMRKTAKGISSLDLMDKVMRHTESRNHEDRAFRGLDFTPSEVDKYKRMDEEQHWLTVIKPDLQKDIVAARHARTADLLRANVHNELNFDALTPDQVRTLQKIIRRLKPSHSSYGEVRDALNYYRESLGSAGRKSIKQRAPEVDIAVELRKRRQQLRESDDDKSDKTIRSLPPPPLLDSANTQLPVPTGPQKSPPQNLVATLYDDEPVLTEDEATPPPVRSRSERKEELVDLITNQIRGARSDEAREQVWKDAKKVLGDQEAREILYEMLRSKKPKNIDEFEVPRISGKKRMPDISQEDFAEYYQGIQTGPINKKKGWDEKSEGSSPTSVTTAISSVATPPSQAPIDVNDVKAEEKQSAGIDAIRYYEENRATLHRMSVNDLRATTSGLENQGAVLWRVAQYKASKTATMTPEQWYNKHFKNIPR